MNINKIKFFFTYFYNMTTGFYSFKSIVGALLFFIIIAQCLTGFFLSIAYVPDSLLYPISRDFDDMEDLFADDILWMHERGVDLIFIFVFLHVFRKLFLINNYAQFNTWSTGAFLFILIHISVFFGLSLCCTHLSDITMTIAANLIYSILFKINNITWFLFTDSTLNLDVLMRLSILHYLVSFFLLVFSFLHLIDMHYDWKDLNYFSGSIFNIIWSSNVVKFEFYNFFLFFLFIYLYAFFCFDLNEPTSYELFTWGDVGIVNDIRFLGVSPHWYFRAYMSWLLVCPHHYIGLFGLIFFIICLSLQNWLKKSIYMYFNNYNKFYSVNFNVYYVVFYVFFLLSICYTFSMLPYGKFYNRLYGNFFLLFSYFFIYIYISNTYIYIYLKINFFLQKKNIIKI